MGRDILDIGEIDRTQVALVGGKAAHLGALARLEGIDVPAGFCVTTDGYRRVVAGVPGLDGLLDRLARRHPDDREGIGHDSARVRAAVAGADVPPDLVTSITGAVAGLGVAAACAVRSSATSEDAPTMSSAGLHETFLDVVGPGEVVRQVRRCWSSLFTERAVVYRLVNGVDHRSVAMAVLVQELVDPTASGVLFTADPVTSDRTVVCIEAVPGLGESLVSGRSAADVFRVRDGDVVSEAIVPERRGAPTLTGAQVVRLAGLGRRIEARLGHPQDVEWCRVADGFRIVQSRPITTLFPVPEADDDALHVYVSVGHQQMMTDPLKPLGLSFWQLTTPRPMAEAGARLFVDVAALLSSPATRPGLLEGFARSDPLIGDALRSVVDRGDLPEVVDGGPPAPPGIGPLDPLDADPALVAELVERGRSSVAALREEIRSVAGPALFDFIRADFDELRRALFDPRGLQVIRTAMEAAWWLNDRLGAWLGETNVADTLSLSVPGNVTSEMGLALLAVADVVRPHRAVVDLLRRVDDDGFVDELPGVPGGTEARDAFVAWLDRYGMRCVGEIDITRPRWSERPSAVVPLLLGHVEHAEPGAAGRLFEAGRRRARAKEREVLVRLASGPDGEVRAAETRRMIARLRTFSGFREYPKYGMVCRYAEYRRVLLVEADRLVRDRVLPDREDVFFLRFDEFADVVRTGRADGDLVRRRRQGFGAARALIPPRVFTSDGEVVHGNYRRAGVPPDALVGLPVSSGVVEGRARVVREPADAGFAPGDILVTAYTDPSWTPAFVSVAGLVTEVGGLMTHGAVIAREYGLPAVVGVERATQRIGEGEWIRVNGTDGFVERMAGPAAEPVGAGRDGRSE